MKQLPLFATLAISLLILLSCFNHDNDPELIVEINIQGTVKDAATGKPIADAEVTLSFEGKKLQKTKTNGKGVFTFPVSQDGDYHFLVQATGYRDAEKTFPLTDLSNNDVDIKMTLANSLTITNESSYDIEGVKWSNGNADFGLIRIAGSVEVPVDTGSGYVFFTRVSDRLNVHTEYVSVKQGERKKYIIADTTIVVEVGYGNNKKTLGAIKTTNPNPSSSAVAHSSSSAVVSSSSSKPSSSSSALPSSSSLVQSSSSVVVSSSSSKPSSSSSTSPSSSSLAQSSSSVVVSSSSSKPSSSSIITYTLTCINLPTTGTAGTAITPPTVTCNGTTVPSGVLTWTGIPDWSKPETGIYNVSVSASYGDCNGKTASCGTLTVIVPPSKGNDIAKYKTVPIGDQVWMAENLDYYVSGSKCYKNSEANCAIYGRLYDWATAMALPSSCNSSTCASQVNTKHKGICPSGWHIPNDDEWTTLINFVGGSLTAGKHLKAREGWNSCGPSGSSKSYSCEDTHSFSALPGGYDYSGGSFGSVGYGYWWSSSEYSAYIAYSRIMVFDSEGVGYNHYNKDRLQSVRCLQDSARSVTASRRQAVFP